MSTVSRMSLAAGKHFLAHSFSSGGGSQCHARNLLAISRIRGNPKRCVSRSTPCLREVVEPLTTMTQLNGVRKIIMSSNKTRNALSLQMMEDLIHSITCNQDDPALRCIVLFGEGRVFSAGHNLKELTAKDGSEFHQQVFATCSRLMLGIIQCPVPVIAVVQGLAAAAGCQLVATCDIALCTEGSSFSTPGASFGIFCSTPGIAVGRAVPRKVAAHMLFTGLPLTADEALRAGLVSKVVCEENLEDELKVIIDSIKSKSRSVIEIGKHFFYQQIETDLKTAYKLGEEVMVNNLALGDGQEGIKSFIDKRKPNWSHTSAKATT